MGTEVHGDCDEAFGAVRDAFAANFDAGTELGASVAVTVDGEPVVDLWAGSADASGRPWEHDTIVNVYSTTKTMAATCVLMLADRGEIDLEAPVATYWPEFAANGKEAVTVGHVMGHTAGLPGFDPPIDATTLYDWDAVCANLAAQRPWWEPGTASGYHAVTQGFLQGEVVRRVTGRTIGTFFQEEVAGPLGADVHMGLPASEDHRVADLVPPPAGLEAAFDDTGSIAYRALSSCRLDATEPTTRQWREAEIPAAGGTANARGVARVHSALACGGEVDGVRLMSTAGVEQALVERHHGTDLVLDVPLRLGTGFGLPSPEMPVSPSERAFFWGGWGGSICVIDLDQRMSFAYVMNKMAPTLTGDLRGGMVLMTTYGALATRT